MNPQGIYTLVSHGDTLVRKLETLTNNIANIDTPGYRADQPAFAALLSTTLGTPIASDDETFAHHEHISPYIPGHSYYVGLADMGQDRRLGPLQHTGNPLDLALPEADLFFSIDTPQGERFTRAGNFSLDPQNRLISAEGRLLNGLEGPLQTDGSQVSFNAEGTLLAADLTELGQLKIVRFPNLEGLQKQGDGLWNALNPSRNPLQIAEDAKLLSGTLEGSNVRAVQELTRMIEANRAYGAMQRALHVTDTMNEQAISLARTS